MVSSLHVEPVSRSDQYKKVMKPLLERKRRARINRCLDELRDLLVCVLQSEGEAVTRLEKADILELTVRHVRRLSQRRRLALPPPGAKQQQDREDVAKFQQGFVAAAQQVQSFLMATNSLEPTVSTRLLSHLSSYATSITPLTNTSMVSPQSPSTSPAHPPPSQHSQNQPQSAAPVPIRPPAQPVTIVQPLDNKSSSPSSPQLSFAVPTVPQQPVVSQPSNQQHTRMVGSSNLTSFYSTQRKESSYPQQPLIDLSNRQVQNSPIAVRDVQCEDRKVAPSPFIDVVSTENDFPQLKPPHRPPQPSNGPLIKSEPVTPFSTPRSSSSNGYDLSHIRLQIQAKVVASMAVSETQARMQPIGPKQEGNSSTEGGQKRPHSSWSPPQERSSSPYPQDLSMKKYEDGQSSWRPW